MWGTRGTDARGGRTDRGRRGYRQGRARPARRMGDCGLGARPGRQHVPQARARTGAALYQWRRRDVAGGRLRQRRHRRRARHHLVMAAYMKGAPLRVIGNAGAGSGEYWYVLADSPIKTMADAGGRTIAYSTTGSSSHLIVLSLIKANGLFARAVPTGSADAALARVMSG